MGEAVAELLAPVRERYQRAARRRGGLEAALQHGAERAREIAVPAMAEVRDVMGIGPRGSAISGDAALKKCL